MKQICGTSAHYLAFNGEWCAYAPMCTKRAPRFPKFRLDFQKLRKFQKNPQIFAKCAPSVRRVCAGYAPGMRRVCAGYAPGMRREIPPRFPKLYQCAQISEIPPRCLPSVRQVCAGYAPDMRRACAGYAPRMSRRWPPTTLIFPETSSLG